MQSQIEGESNYGDIFVHIVFSIDIIIIITPFVQHCEPSIKAQCSIRAVL